jgi:sigma-B regulation protein RsbU (phosphoserine phosphatase)
MPDYLASYKERSDDLISEDQKISRRLIELSALFEISQTLNSSLNLKSILDNILLVPMGRMMIGKGLILLKNEGQNYKVESVKGVKLSLINKNIELNNLPSHPFFIADIADELEWKSFFVESKIELLIPFVARTEILGVLAFGKKLTNQSLTEEETEFLTSLSNIATTSIENALVFEKLTKVNLELDHKIQELNTLFDIGKELNLTFDKQTILKLISYALMGQVTVNNFIIAAKEGNYFKAELVKGSQFKLNTGEKCQHLCDKSTMITSPYIREDNTEYDDLLNEKGIQVVVPMRIQNEIKGFIFLGDKITKQEFRASDLEFLQTLGNIAIISLENARLFQETLEKQRLEEEMALARNIQMRLLPKDIPQFENIKIHGLNIPSKHVGGDYFDVIKIEENLIALAIADVSGKGMPASLLMSNLQASLQSLVFENRDLSKLVGQINNVIYRNTDPEKYITFFIGLFNTDTYEFQYVNAGHNPPYVYGENGEIKELSEGGIILGMMPDIKYEVGKIYLNKNDWLVTFTDGVTEAMTVDDEEFEEKRVIEFIKNNSNFSSPEQFNNLLIEKIYEFVGDAPQNDDITLLTLKM